MLTFTSFETDVLDAIYQHIVPFFVLHNFGQRQSKGFGSFTVSSVNGNPVPGYPPNPLFGPRDVEQILLWKYGTVYCLNLENYKSRNREIIADYKRKNGGKDDISTYEIIHNEYQFLKAGRSSRAAGGYEKSKLFKFFVEGPDRIRWEKRKIKQEINSKIGSAPFYNSLWQQREPIDFDPSNLKYYNSWKDNPAIPDDSYRYIRALLGLAENNEYLTDDGKKIDRNHKRTHADEKYLVKIEHKPSDPKNEIERLASPILFKVIDDIVYLLPQTIDPRIFNQKFKFSVKKETLDELCTPKQTEFNLLTFLDYALDKTIWQLLS